MRLGVSGSSFMELTRILNKRTGNQKRPHAGKTQNTVTAKPGHRQPTSAGNFLSEESSRLPKAAEAGGYHTPANIGCWQIPKPWKCGSQLKLEIVASRTISIGSRTIAKLRQQPLSLYVSQYLSTKGTALLTRTTLPQPLK